MRTETSVILLVSISIVFLTTGCGDIRFAPDQTQKQNAYLHHRTVQATAARAKNENVSDALCQLTMQAARQSDAILSYYGLPKTLPASDSVEELLNQENKSITQNARLQAIQRPDPWDAADNLMELGIALAGLAGGMFGSRAIATLKLARQKSTALKEIIAGNELFKKQNGNYAEAFKEAHHAQSDTTKILVATNK